MEPASNANIGQQLVSPTTGGGAIATRSPTQALSRTPSPAVLAATTTTTTTATALPSQSQLQLLRAPRALHGTNHGNQIRSAVGSTQPLFARGHLSQSQSQSQAKAAQAQLLRRPVSNLADAAAAAVPKEADDSDDADATVSSHAPLHGATLPISSVVVIVLLALAAGAIIAWCLKPSHVRHITPSVPALPSSASASPAPAQPQTQAPASASAPAPALSAAEAQAKMEQQRAQYDAMLAASKAFVASIQHKDVVELTSEAQAIALLSAKAPAVLLIYKETCGHCRQVMPAFNAAAAAAAASVANAEAKTESNKLVIPFYRIAINTVPVPTLGPKFQINGVPFFVGIKADGTTVSGTGLHDRSVDGMLTWAATLMSLPLQPQALSPAPAPAAPSPAAPSPSVAPTVAPAVARTAAIVPESSPRAARVPRAAAVPAAPLVPSATRATAST